MGLRQVRCTNLSLAQAKGRCEHRAIKQTCCHARVCRKRGSSPFARARAHAHTWRSPVAGALTINVGDMLQVYSNDRYVAPLHRVLANREKHRYSAPFFFNPVSPPAPPVAPRCTQAPRQVDRNSATRQLPGLISDVRSVSAYMLGWGMGGAMVHGHVDGDAWRVSSRTRQTAFRSPPSARPSTTLVPPVPPGAHASCVRHACATTLRHTHMP